MNTIIFDLETDNVDFLNPKVVLCCYEITNPQFVGTCSGMVKGDNIRSLKRIIESPDYLKVCHNIKFEMGYLRSLGIRLNPPFYCTQVASWLLRLGKPKKNNAGKIEYHYGLKDIAETYLGYKDLRKFKDLAKEHAIEKETNRVLKSGKKQIIKKPAVSSEIPEGILTAYCKQDVEMTRKLFFLTKKRLVEKHLWKLFVSLETPLIIIFEQMERYGIKIDESYLTQLASNIRDQITDLERRMNELVEPCAAP